jgi:hypothetical protein
VRRCSVNARVVFTLWPAWRAAGNPAVRGFDSHRPHSVHGKGDHAEDHFPVGGSAVTQRARRPVGERGEVGEILYQARVTYGLRTCADASQHLRNQGVAGVCQTGLTGYESGRRMPPADKFLAILRAYERSFILGFVPNGDDDEEEVTAG